MKKGIDCVLYYVQTGIFITFIRLFVNNIFSVQTPNIRNFFFGQLVNKTADCFNNIVFILVAKISSKKVCEKMVNNLRLDKVLLVCNRNAELLRLVEATFDSKVAFHRRKEKKNLILLKSLPIFVLFLCRC